MWMFTQFLVDFSIFSTFAANRYTSYIRTWRAAIHSFVLLVFSFLWSAVAVLVGLHIKIDFMMYNMLYVLCRPSSPFSFIVFNRVNKWACDNGIISNFGTFLHVIIHLSEKLFTIIPTFRMEDSVLPLSSSSASSSLPLTKSHSLQQRHTHTRAHPYLPKKKLCQPHKRIIDCVFKTV